MKEYFPRELTKKIIKHLGARQIFAVLGPRQAGKTTLFSILQKYLKQKKGVAQTNIFYFSFEEPETRNQFNKNPKEFIERKIADLKGRVYFFFDEYHWAQEGGQKLKLLFDFFTPKVKFFITGSSSLELTFQTGKFLVGRLFYFHLYPLSFQEFLPTKEKEVFSAYQETKGLIKKFKTPQTPTIFDNQIQRYFEQFCLFGGYPEVIKQKNKETKQLVLKSVVNTYLEKDIRSLLLIEDLEGYRKLLQILSSQIGKLLSYQNISSDTGLNFNLLKKYLTTLEETYVIKRVRPFYQNVASELRKIPKLYFIDLGLRNYLIQAFNPLETQTDKGNLVENFVFSQSTKEETSLNYWRTKGKAEVDFILKKEKEIIPLEVKYQSLTKPTVSRSLASFLTQYQPDRAFILTKGFWGKTKIEKTKVLFAPAWYW